MSQNSPTHIHSLNTSPAKQKYSFSRQDRFKYPAPPTDVYYMPTPQSDRRSALIGMGQRSLAAINTVPFKDVPHSYDLPSTLKANKGYSFKAGRPQVGGPFQNLKYFDSIPGPNSYGSISTLSPVGASLKHKLADFSLKCTANVPGPGAYSVPSTLKTGEKSIIQSKYSSGGSVRLSGMSRSVEMEVKKELLQPGPGQYDVLKYGMGNPESPYVVNQMTIFSRQARLGKQKVVTQPGPGQYKVYSQFES